MRRRLVLFALSLLTIGSVIVVVAQQRRTSLPPERSTAGDYTLSGPYSHANLTVFLLHGPDRMTGKAPLTL